ncbi:hypothetical protein TSOC_009838 [Tetrabaena socialis]|uniref:Uncharacterized protein n=1 Tax=Tetrabaena socialis TaxID=47790 RepID=A0A2J7ZUU1_9CHLO|nr:hypothetical protein TSOC_009838 [Tetrabaena socialis]|eukprot:PNH04044.1 hypothetical protein TSOC_009838 [Tetrabaena socialis]
MRADDSVRVRNVAECSAERAHRCQVDAAMLEIVRHCLARINTAHPQGLQAAAELLGPGGYMRLMTLIQAPLPAAAACGAAADGERLQQQQHFQQQQNFQQQLQQHQHQQQRKRPNPEPVQYAAGLPPQGPGAQQQQQRSINSQRSLQRKRQPQPMKAGPVFQSQPIKGMSVAHGPDGRLHNTPSM